MFGERYKNKRLVFRKGGKYAKPTMGDFGIGGVCECGHLKIWNYDGDLRDEHPNPLKFGYRCFTCNPKTEEELKVIAEIEASRPKTKSIYEMLQEIIDNE